MSMEDVERILDETQESVEYQRVLLKKISMSGTAKLPVFIWIVGFPPHMMSDNRLR